MKFMNQIGEISSNDNHSSQRGNEYYQNLCMKAGEQFAIEMIMPLFDKRFNTNNRIRQKLPTWINQSLIECHKFGHAIGKIAGFFKNKVQRFSSNDV
ncbi:6187_t:CDS:2 [Funneliformis geosporum]|uniref:6187_t:CDS:1 n=1 Tax=Funneliformis geosporum TaxID=1117311 RepID=A0A9W4TCQ3_9GLOM|nr:6187_t:CDS:2 [Funneliformis geosporum]